MKKVKNNNTIIAINAVMCFLLIANILLSQQQSKEQNSETRKVIFQDNFRRVSSWELYKADGAEVRSVSSKNNDVPTLKVDYDLGTKEWVAVEKPVNLMLKDSYALKFKMLSTGKRNNLEIKFVDSDGSVFGNKRTLPTNGWEEVIINSEDFEYWWGGDDKLDTVVRIGFAISKNEGGKGTLELSELEIVEVPKKVKQLPPNVLDDFETKQRWTIFSSENAMITLKNLPGKDGNSLVAEYDLGSGEGKWVAFEKRYKLDFTKNKTLSFWIKAEGENNRVEFKVIDEDGSIFGKRYEDISNQWEEIKISVDELEYWWGGDDKLTRPVKIGFAISSIDGGKGKIFLDNLKLTR